MPQFVSLPSCPVAGHHWKKVWPHLVVNKASVLLCNAPCSGRGWNPLGAPGQLGRERSFLWVEWSWLVLSGPRHWLSVLLGKKVRGWAPHGPPRARSWRQKAPAMRLPPVLGPYGCIPNAQTLTLMFQVQYCRCCQTPLKQAVKWFQEKLWDWEATTVRNPVKCLIDWIFTFQVTLNPRCYCSVKSVDTSPNVVRCLCWLWKNGRSDGRYLNMLEWLWKNIWKISWESKWAGSGRKSCRK